MLRRAEWFLYYKRILRENAKYTCFIRHPFFGSPGNNIPSNALAGVFIENSPFDPNAVPHTHPVISNLTVIGSNKLDGSSSSYEDTPCDRRRGYNWQCFFRIRNSLLLGFPLGAWFSMIPWPHIPLSTINRTWHIQLFIAMTARACSI